MPYSIQYSAKAIRNLDRLPQEARRRIIDRIQDLGQNPRPVGAIKLAGQDAYRARVGDYRVIYAIADERLLVLIVDVGHRREIYRDL